MESEHKPELVPTVGHDMSRFWRLVSNDGGLITGTWWVTRADRRGEQHVKPIDVRARHAHVEAEANARLDEIAAAVLAVATAPDWPEEADGA